MGIIVRFIVRNIKEKKFRTFMLVLSIVISTALFFSTMSIADTLKNMYITQLRKYYGTAEIMITANNDSPSLFVNMKKAQRLAEQCDYIIGGIKGNGTYKNQDETYVFQLEGIGLEDLKLMGPLQLSKAGDLENFEGKKIIISKQTAEDIGITLGDSMTININEVDTKFEVYGIAEPAGRFTEYGDEHIGIIPKKMFKKIYDCNNDVSIIYIKTKDASQKQQIIEKLSEEYTNYSVAETITDEEVATYANRISLCFSLMVVAVLFMCMYIIYTSFKIIALERIPIVGTFRSIGARKQQTNNILYIESIIYGIIGGGIGVIAGIGLLYLMAIVTRPEWMKGMEVSIDYGKEQLLLAFAIAIIISFMSAIVPVMKIANIPIKDIVLNKIEKVNKKNGAMIIVAIIMLIISQIIPVITPYSIALVMDVLSILFIICSIVILMPIFIKVMVKILGVIYQIIFGNIGNLACKNLRDNKSISTNISLMAVGVAILLMITSSSESVVETSTNVYKDRQYDIQIQMEKMKDKVQKNISSLEGVEDALGIYEANNVDIVGTNEKITIVRGVNDYNFSDYYTISCEEDNDTELLSQLQEGKNIIISTDTKKKLNIQKGERLTLAIGEKKQEYTVIGFIEVMEKLGKAALISEKNIIKDLDSKYYTTINVKVSKSEDIEKVKEQLKYDYRDDEIQVYSIQELTQELINVNAQLFSILTFFSLAILLIACLGIVNNVIISFIERKKSMAVLRSVGMDSYQLLKMVMIEAVTGGIIAATVGIGCGALMIRITPYLYETTGYKIQADYSLILFVEAIVISIVLMTGASILPGKKAAKLNIIEAIKFE